MQLGGIMCKKRCLTSMGDVHTCSIGGADLIMTAIWLLGGELAHLARQVMSSARINVPC